uniref:Cadherin domain-containing protein n=1 Tax=Globisporangium ultimum (strain ATCC 200006 / CBS 805.95 / DAOM BR144) TaxID=431595 RepID=K3XCC0_GLOUD
MATPRFLSLPSKSFFYFGKQTADQFGTNAALSQDSASTRSITLFDIESSTRDADRGFILHLNCSKGYLSLNRGCNELTFVRGNQSESVSMTVQGSLRSLNCAVEKVTYHAKLDASGWDDIFVTLEERSDKELLGDDGRLYSTTKRIPIEIHSINDAPIIQMSQTYFALHNAWVQLANIAISDADAGDGLVYIQLKVHNGILRVGRSAERIVHLGKTPDTVDAVGSNLEFAATISDAALVFEDLEYKCSIQLGCRDGMRDYLTIYVDDNGFTGSGGAQLSTNSAVIQIQSGA